MIKKLIFLVVLGVSLGFAIRNYMIEWIYIASGSMEPTLHVETRLFVNKLAYIFRDPKRGEIICFQSPMEGDKKFVKRIIAVEGDKIEIINKVVWINGSEPEEPYIQHTREEARFMDDNFGLCVVPEGTVFVMGDNRDESNDSRNWVDPKTKEPTPFIMFKAIEGRIFGFY